MCEDLVPQVYHLFPGSALGKRAPDWSKLRGHEACTWVCQRRYAEHVPHPKLTMRSEQRLSLSECDIPQVFQTLQSCEEPLQGSQSFDIFHPNCARL